MMDKNSQNNTFDEASTLFGEVASSRTVSLKRKKRAAKRRLIAIIVLAAFVLVATLAYFFVIKPMLAEDGAPIAEPVEVSDGEVLDTDGTSVLMYRYYELGEIKTIAVHNGYGEFSFSYNEEYNTFFLDGYPKAPYDTDLFTSLAGAARYALIRERVYEDCEDMSEYGLNASQDPAYFTLTTHAGESHTVYIGNQTAAGTGYYARLEGRNTVYVIGPSVGKTVLAPVESLVVAQLTLPLEANAYYMITDFAIIDGDEIRVFITRLDEKEQEEAALTTMYAMLSPGNYLVNTTNYTPVLEQLGDFSGSSTLALSPDEETLAKYGLLEPAHTVYFEYDGMEQAVFLSEKNENGNYYAYSLLFDLIAEIRTDTAAWLDWDLMKWVDYPVFLMNINDIKRITVESDTATRVFDLEGTEAGLVVTELGSGFMPSVDNFREFYKVLLLVHNQGYVSNDLSEDEVGELVDGGPSLTITLETRAGKTTVYKYYPYSTRRAYYTVNGEGIFYVLREMADKIIADAENVMTNTPIDATAKG